MAQGNPLGRSARYAITSIDAVRLNNIRTDEQVIEAQRGITPDMMNALEEMVNAARAGKLEGRAALTVAAIKW